MILLTVDEVAELHEKVVKATGGSQGIRDAGLLESSVLGCYQTFDGDDLYPTLTEKAGRLAYMICKNHPFVDGNKRAAVISMLVILRMNDVILSYTQRELIALGLGIASSGIEYEDIVLWINEHIVK